jgi:cytoskeletal protein CcmA (bactofilin family)
VPDLRIERGATAKLDPVDGDLRVGKGARISPAKGNLLVVSGQASFEGDARVDSSFQCGSLIVERWGELKVAGDLTVSNGIDVSNSIDVKGALKAKAIDVGGRLRARSASCEGNLRAGGVVEVEGALEADLVDVGGKVVAGRVKLKDLKVGGKVEVRKHLRPHQCRRGVREHGRARVRRDPGLRQVLPCGWEQGREDSSLGEAHRGWGLFVRGG